MPGSFAPVSYADLNVDYARQLQQTSVMDQLPSYSASTKGRAPVNVQEKESQPPNEEKTSSTYSTLKSILNGSVHKHNPRYVLEESVTGRTSVAREQRTSQSSISSSSSSSSSPSSSSSTLMSILKGDVWKHHPAYRLEEEYRREEERQKRLRNDQRVDQLRRA